MSQRVEVATALVNAIKKRIRINLRARILDDLVIRVERGMFTEHTGKSRIEDSSVAHIRDAIMSQRWTWEGSVNDQIFMIRVPVVKMFTQFTSIDDLNEWNAKDSTLVMTPKKPTNQPGGR